MFWKSTTVRASAGKGFRAPLLSELNANDAFSAESARDLVTCREAGVPDAECAESQYDTFIRANPDLDPETIRTYEVVWEQEGSGWWDRAGVLATSGGRVFQRLNRAEYEASLRSLLGTR